MCVYGVATEEPNSGYLINCNFHRGRLIKLIVIVHYCEVVSKLKIEMASSCLPKMVKDYELLLQGMRAFYVKLRKI